MSTELRAYAREVARREGIDPEMFVRQIDQESGFDPDAYNAASGAAGIAQIVARFHPDVDPWDPIASLDYAARWMAQLRVQLGTYRKALAAYNWGPGNVARWDGSPDGLPAETRHYLDVILGPGWPEPGQGGPAPEEGAADQWLRVVEDGVRLRTEPSTSAPIVTQLNQGTLVAALSPFDWRPVRVGERVGWIASDFLAPAETPPDQPPAVTRYRFDPTTPTELQVQDWTCSIRSVMWMLKSIGIAVTPAEAQDAMSPRYVSSDLGLLDATGAGIVEVLRERWHLSARNDPSAAFDEVAALAGRVPLAIGLRNWGGRGQGHWSAVRGFDSARLLLANPAGTGPRFGHQALTRSDFDARGPASMVWIPLEDG